MRLSDLRKIIETSIDMTKKQPQKKYENFNQIAPLPFSVIFNIK
jgi:hypothetical protein